MKTFNRVCIQSCTVEIDNYKKFTVERGKEYITSDVNSEGSVTVFSSYWVSMPASLFAGAIPGPGNPHAS
jgi:hypothetical protein